MQPCLCLVWVYGKVFGLIVESDRQINESNNCIENLLRTECGGKELGLDTQNKHRVTLRSRGGAEKKNL